MSAAGAIAALFGLKRAKQDTQNEELLQQAQRTGTILELLIEERKAATKKSRRRLRLLKERVRAVTH